MSTMAFLHDRLTVEGGVILKPSGNDARDLSLSDSDDNGCTSTMDNEVIGGLNSDDTVCAAPAATSCRAPVSENSPRSEDQAADPSDSCFSCAHTCPQHEGQGSTHAVTAKNDDTITISPEVKDAVEAASVSVLKEKLADIPHDEKSALVHVQRVAPALVNDNHLLIFLRHKGFDVDVSCLFGGSVCSFCIFHLLLLLSHVCLSSVLDTNPAAAPEVRTQGSCTLLGQAIQSVWFRKVHIAHDSLWYVFTMLTSFPRKQCDSNCHKPCFFDRSNER